MKLLVIYAFLIIAVTLFVVIDVNEAKALYYEGDDIEFSWSYDFYVYDYVLEIDDNFHLFGDYSWFLPWFRKRTIWNHYIYYNFPAGHCYWHVLAYDFQGHLVGYTDPKSFTVYERPYYIPSTYVPLSLTVPLPVSIQQADRGSIKGKVTNTAGEPIAGATVKLFDIWGGYSQRPTDPYVITTDASGNFELGTVRTGIYNIRYEASGYIAQEQEGLTLGAGQTLSPPTCVMAPCPGAIRGFVLNNLSQPIPGTAVRMHNILTPTDNTVVPTNSGGEFRFSHVADDIYHVYYDTSGYIGQVQHNISVQGGVTTAPTVILSPGGVSAATGEIFGKVVDQAGQTIPGTCIRINMSLMPTNTAGEFRFTLVHPGIYTIYDDAPGYKGQIQENITVNVGQITSCPTVIMSPYI